MIKRITTRQQLLAGTTLVGLGVALSPTAALADCLADASGTTVTCTTADPNGYDGSAVNTLTINVTPSSTVSGTLLTGTGSAVNNEGGINVTGTAISVGGGSIVNNASTSTGGITGDILFGATSGTQVNTLNSFGASPNGITGNIASAGAFVVNNTGDITGNISSDSTLALDNSGSITGNVSAAGNTTANNSGTLTGDLSSGGTLLLDNSGTLTGNVSAVGDTTIDNSGTLTGNVTLGAGNDTITNTGTLSGNVDMGGGTNTFNASNGADLPSGTLTADAAGLNTLNLGAGGGTLNIAVTNFDVMNVDGGNAVYWVLGQPISLSDKINLNSGILEVGNASYLGSNTIVNNAGPVAVNGLYFDGSAAGTYSGNMSGTGVVYVGFAGTAVTTFSGTNTYTGGTYIQTGTLQVTGGSALADNGDVQIGGGGTLDVAQTETIGGLFDGLVYGGTGFVTLSGGDLIINNGAFSGAISGSGGIEKIGTGTLTLSGTNTFTGPATVTDGTLVLSGGSAIGDTTAVVVNATSTTSGTLQVDTAETIGSLAGNGGSVVLNAGLTTGGDNTDTSYAGVISGTGSLTKEGTGIFTLTGANTYGGGTTVNNGTLAGNTTSLQGDILVNASGTLLFDQAANGTYSGDLTGTGTVTKISAGTLTLTGLNTGFGGTTNLNGGTVSIASENNIGTGTLAFDGGTLQTTDLTTLGNSIVLNAGGGTVQTDADTVFTGDISGVGGLTKTGLARLTLEGPSSYGGLTTVSQGVLQGEAGYSLVGDILNNAEVDFTGVTETYGGDMSGTGNVKVINDALIAFDGVNTYTGSTTIDAGSNLYSFSAGAFSSASAYIVNGFLGMSGVPEETIGSLSGNGLVVTGGGTLNIGADNSSTEFSGVIGSGGYFGDTSLNVNKIGTGTLTLSGTGSVLTGNLGVQGGTLSLTGTLDAATATVDSGATLDVGVDGVLTAAVTSAAGSITRVNGTVNGNVDNSGTLFGSGTIVGALLNQGTLAPGNSPGIITVSGGPFTQTATGTLAIQMTPSAVAGTGYDQVLVTGTPGTAILDGTLALAPATGLYVSGTTYDIIDAAGGITGNFATVTGNVISPFLTLTPTGVVSLTGTEQVYRLTVSRTNYATGIGAGATPNQIAVANGFQALVSGATGDAATLVVGVDNMTAAQARTFFDQASPEPYGAYATGLQDQGELYTRQVALQLNGTSHEAKGPAMWGRAYGQWGKGDDKGSLVGSHQDVYGGALGLEYNADNYVVGVAGGWSHDKVKYNAATSNGSGDSWQIGAYAGFNSGNVTGDVQVSYLHGSYDAIRSINVATINRTASAHFTGELWKVVGTVGYKADLSGISLRPFVGIDYSNGKIKSFTESGAGAADLTVSDINADRTDLMVGLDLAPKASSKISPYGRVAYRYDLKNDDRTISALFNGNSASAFTVSGVKPSRSQVDVDAGVSFAIGERASVFVGYQGRFRSDMNSHGVSGGVRFSLGGS